MTRAPPPRRASRTHRNRCVLGDDDVVYCFVDSMMWSPMELDDVPVLHLVSRFLEYASLSTRVGVPYARLRGVH